MSGKLIIFSAPSGAGKTTIVRHLLSKHSDKFEFSISASTRAPRGQEVDGKDYYFISQEEFLHKIAKQEFIEFEEVYSGTYYGTLRSEVERIWALGKHVIFDIDVVGGLRLKSKFPEEALAIFVNPPSLEVLKERFAKAELELSFSDKFDVVLNNFELEVAKAEAEELVLDFIAQK